MGADGLGNPLNDNLGFGGHQGLANFPETTNCGGVSGVRTSGEDQGFLAQLHPGHLGFLKHCFWGTGTLATTGTFSQVWVGMLTHFSASTFTGTGTHFWVGTSAHTF